MDAPNSMMLAKLYGVTWNLKYLGFLGTEGIWDQDGSSVGGTAMKFDDGVNCVRTQNGPCVRPVATRQV